jgi:hypothetical protein
VTNPSNFAGKLIIADLTNPDKRQDISTLITNLNVSYTMGEASALSFEIVDPFRISALQTVISDRDFSVSRELTFANNNYFIPGRDIIYETQTIGSLDGGTSVTNVKQLFEMVEVTFSQGPGISPTFAVQCYSKGVQQMKRDRNPSAVKGTGTAFVRAAALKYGLKFFGEQTSKPQTITKASGSKQAESLWDVITRLAGDAKFVFFEVDGYFVFASEKFLLNKWGAKSTVIDVPRKAAEKKLGKKTFKKFFPVSFPNSASNPLQLTQFPTISKSANDAYEGNGSLLLNRKNGTQLRPGMTIKVDNIPNMSNYYLVTEVSFPDMSPEPVTVSFRTPSRDEEKEKPKELAIGTSYKQSYSAAGSRFAVKNISKTARDSSGGARQRPWLGDARLLPLPAPGFPLSYPRMAKANITKLYDKASILSNKAESSTLQANTVVATGNLDLWDRPVLIADNGEAKTVYSVSHVINATTPYLCVVLPLIYTEGGVVVQKTEAEVIAKYNADGGYLGSAKYFAVVSGPTKRNAIINARDYGLLLSWQNELVLKKRFGGPASEAIGGPDSEWT